METCNLKIKEIVLYDIEIELIVVLDGKETEVKGWKWEIHPSVKMN